MRDGGRREREKEAVGHIVESIYPSPFDEFDGTECLIHVAQRGVVAEVSHGCQGGSVAGLEADKVSERDAGDGTGHVGRADVWVCFDG